jgi:hypothetical protein
MGRRTAVPLHKNRMAKFIDAAHEIPRDNRKVTGLLAIGSGGRYATVAHTHSNWFEYDDKGNLYYRIPASDDCRIGNGDGPCGACNKADKEKYTPKTPAGTGRRILIKNTYTDHSQGGRNGKEAYLGLRDVVENYFALTGPNAPDDVRHGFEMIESTDCPGFSNVTGNEWLREIAAQSAIRKGARHDRLVNENSVSNDDIADFGYDNDGNGIPDIIFHDMRASFCTQLMRNEIPPAKAINKTGHKDPDSMKPYIMFAQNEIGVNEEQGYF